MDKEELTNSTQLNKTNKTDKTNKPNNLKFVIPIIILTIATCGLAGYLIYDKCLNNKTEEVVVEEEEVAEAEVPDSSNKTNTDNSSANTEEEMIYFPASSDEYIELPEVGIKIRIPDNIQGLAYRVSDQQQYNLPPSFSFWGVPKGFQYYPDFANPSKNTSGIGYLTPLPADTDCSAGPICYGTEVFSTNNYKFFAYGPQAYYSGEPWETEYEKDSIKLIMDMLENNISEL